MVARLRKAAEGAALMAGVEGKLTVQAGDYEVLVNRRARGCSTRTCSWLGPIAYTPEEEAFARALQRAAGSSPKGMDAADRALEGQPQEGGSTDVGDVSWNVPTLHVRSPRLRGRAVARVARGRRRGHVDRPQGHGPGREDPGHDHGGPLRRRRGARGRPGGVREKTRGFVYKPYVPDGPPAVPKAE